MYEQTLTYIADIGYSGKGSVSDVGKTEKPRQQRGRLIGDIYSSGSIFPLLSSPPCHKKHLSRSCSFSSRALDDSPRKMPIGAAPMLNINV
jgi:hypothetical protein